MLRQYRLQTAYRYLLVFKRDFRIYRNVAVRRVSLWALLPTALPTLLTVLLELMSLTLWLSLVKDIRVTMGCLLFHCMQWEPATVRIPGIVLTDLS